MTKPNLKTVESAPTFPDKLGELLALNAERRDLARVERAKMALEPALALIAKQARCDVGRFEALDAELQALTPAPENEYVLLFVERYKHRAIERLGNLTPPLSNWTHPQEVPMLAMGCMLAHCTPIELIGVAWLRAGRESPQTFAEGCTDPGERERQLAAFESRFAALCAEAAELVTLADLRIEFHGAGSARVTYEISNGEVPASGPGDPRGIPALVAWLEAREP